MKKLFLVLIMVLIVFSACTVDLGDMLLDEVAVHNALVDSMDAVLNAEEGFYEVYIELFEDDEVAPLRDAYDNFTAKVDDLDAYYRDTEFSTDQQVFIDEYNAYYKPFLTEYVDYAGEFVNALETQGVTFDVMDPYITDLDQYTQDFVETHNRLIDTINLQAGK